MARKPGSVNKETKLPEAFSMTAEQRLEVLASILADIVSEELCKQD